MGIVWSFFCKKSNHCYFVTIFRFFLLIRPLLVISFHFVSIAQGQLLNFTCWIAKITKLFFLIIIILNLLKYFWLQASLFFLIMVMMRATPSTINYQNPYYHVSKYLYHLHTPAWVHSTTGGAFVDFSNNDHHHNHHQTSDFLLVNYELTKFVFSIRPSLDFYFYDIFVQTSPIVFYLILLLFTFYSLFSSAMSNLISTSLMEWVSQANDSLIIHALTHSLSLSKYILPHYYYQHWYKWWTGLKLCIASGSYCSCDTVIIIIHLWTHTFAL